MPASTCARPPYASARPNTTGSPLAETSPELNMLRTNVVSANAASPSGPGSASGLGTNETLGAADLPADGSVAARSARGSRVVRASRVGTDDASIGAPFVDVRARRPAPRDWSASFQSGAGVRGTRSGSEPRPFADEQHRRRSGMTCRDVGALRAPLALALLR